MFNASFTTTNGAFYFTQFKKQKIMNKEAVRSALALIPEAMELNQKTEYNIETSLLSDLLDIDIYPKGSTEKIWGTGIDLSTVKSGSLGLIDAESIIYGLANTGKLEIPEDAY